jgi:hypothetical protein
MYLMVGVPVVSGTTPPEGEFEVGEDPSEKGALFFREDWKETPPQTPVTQRHVQNPDLLLTRHGPAENLIKKSHHEQIPNDPWYIWSGLCEKGRWALSLQKKDALVDLSEKGSIRWRTKQSGKHILKVVLGLDDGTWLVSDKGSGETSDWHEFSLNVELLRWHELDIRTMEAGSRVKQPDLRRVRSVGWTDLMVGEGSSGCTRVDWIEVHGTTVRQ